jgi:predicted  nucleic acid-binding Zn-ribbon protein
MGIGVFEVIGAMLVAYVMGAVMKDWISQKSLIMRAYVDALIVSLSTRSRWYHECQQALRQVATLDQTIRAMDDARNGLHAAITHDLVPKIKHQDDEITTLRVQLNEAYSKIENMIHLRKSETHTLSENLRMMTDQRNDLEDRNENLKSKVISLEGDVQYLRGRVALLAKLFVPNAPAFMPTKRKTINFKSPLKRRKK